MNYVEQPVTTKMNLLTLFLQQLGLFVPKPRDRARVMYCGKRKREGKNSLCSKQRNFTFRMLFPFTMPEMTGSKLKVFRREKKLTWNVGRLTSMKPVPLMLVCSIA